MLSDSNQARSGKRPANPIWCVRRVVGTLPLMSTRANPATAKRMRALVDELKESGLSLAAFARMKGEPTWRLYEWRRRLKRKVAASEPAFVPVRIVDAPNQPAPLEIELGRQRRILVPSGFDETALRRLVRVLEAC